MKTGTCKNCGYDAGIHHYLTNQCPFGGEVAYGRKQEYMTSTFEPETDELAALRERVAELEGALESVEALCDEEMGEWQSVEYGYLPTRLANIHHIREFARAALAVSVHDGEKE